MCLKQKRTLGEKQGIKKMSVWQAPPPPARRRSALRCAAVTQHCGSERPLGAAGRIKRPPRSSTSCPRWAGFRWSLRAARERSESHSGLNWTHHGPGPGRGSLSHRPAPRRGLFQLKLTLLHRGITTGFRVAGHIWTPHMAASTDYTAEMWQTRSRN